MGTTSAPPAFFEFSAPAQWRAIDFISDLHLCEAMPRTFEAWAGHLRHTSADAVFMLGDLFELWVGDDMRSLPFQQHCVDVLAAASQQRCTAFMAGNRDFLLGPDMLRACGMTGLPDPTLLQAWGCRLVLSHGDALCLDDKPYQAFRTQVRSPQWQASFLAKPLHERLEIAAGIRRASEANRAFDGDAAADVDHTAAIAWLQAANATTFVHGHTHRAATHALAPGLTRHVLSDWDLDSASRAEVLRLTRDGFERLPPAAARP